MFVPVVTWHICTDGVLRLLVVGKHRGAQVETKVVLLSPSCY